MNCITLIHMCRAALCSKLFKVKIKIKNIQRAGENGSKKEREKNCQKENKESTNKTNVLGA